MTTLKIQSFVQRCVFYMRQICRAYINIILLLKRCSFVRLIHIDIKELQFWKSDRRY